MAHNDCMAQSHAATKGAAPGLMAQLLHMAPPLAARIIVAKRDYARYFPPYQKFLRTALVEQEMVDEKYEETNLDRPLSELTREEFYAHRRGNWRWLPDWQRRFSVALEAAATLGTSPCNR